MTRLTRHMRRLTPRVILGAMAVLAVVGATAAVPAYRAAGNARPVESAEATTTVADEGRAEAIGQSAEQATALALDTATNAAAERAAREAEIRTAADRVRASAVAAAAAGQDIGGAVGQAADRVARTTPGVPTEWVARTWAARSRHAAETARRTRESADRARESAAVAARDAGRLATRVVGLTDKARSAAAEFAASAAGLAGRTADARGAFVRAEAEAERVAATEAAEAEFERVVASMTEALFQAQTELTWPVAIKTVWEDPAVVQLKSHKEKLASLGFKYGADMLAKDVIYDSATKVLTWTVDANPGVTVAQLREPLLAVVSAAGERGRAEFTNSETKMAILNGFTVVIRPGAGDGEKPPVVARVPCPPPSCDPCAVVTTCRPARTRCCGGLKPTRRCR